MCLNQCAKGLGSSTLNLCNNKAPAEAHLILNSPISASAFINDETRTRRKMERRSLDYSQSSESAFRCRITIWFATGKRKNDDNRRFPVMVLGWRKKKQLNDDAQKRSLACDDIDLTIRALWDLCYFLVMQKKGMVTPAIHSISFKSSHCISLTSRYYVRIVRHSIDCIM